MSTRLAEKAPYWYQLRPEDLRAAGRLMVVGCGDDRWQWGGLQFFGGNYALGMLRGTAMELQKRNSFVEASDGIVAEPVHVLSGAIHIILQKKGMLGVDHEGCAGAAKMREIATTGVNIADTPAGALKAELQRAEAWKIVQATSNMEEGRFDKVSEDLARVALHKVTSYDQARGLMEPSGEDKWQMTKTGLLVPTEDGVPRVPLHEPEHLAAVVAINDDPTHIFNSLAAWEAGSRAYHVSRGRLPEVHDAIEAYTPGVGYRHFEDALTVFAAKTVLNLPMPGGTPGQTLGPQNVQYLPSVEYAHA